MLELNMNSVFNDTIVKSYKLTCIEMLLVLSRFLNVQSRPKNKHDGKSLPR